MSTDPTMPTSEPTPGYPAPGYPAPGYQLNGYRLLAIIERPERAPLQPAAPPPASEAVILAQNLRPTGAAYVTARLYASQGTQPREWWSGEYLSDPCAAYASLLRRAGLPSTPTDAPAPDTVEGADEGDGGEVDVQAAAQAEQFFTQLLAPPTPQIRKARRVAHVREALEVAQRVTDPATDERRVLVEVLHRALRAEQNA